MKYLKSRANPPRPSTPVPVNDSEFRAGKTTPRTGAGDMVELEGQGSWDEDDVILFFWGNTPAAKERHRKEVQERNQRMEAWRESVPQGLA